LEKFFDLDRRFREVTESEMEELEHLVVVIFEVVE